MNILKFKPNTILMANQLNNIVNGIDSLERLIPTISEEEIQREQLKLQQEIQSAKDTIKNIQDLVSEYNYTEITNSISALNSFKAQSIIDIQNATNKVNDYINRFDVLKQVLEGKVQNAENLVSENNSWIIEAGKQLEEAQKSLDDARKTLETLAGTGGSGISIQDALARIVAFAEWYDENKEYINSYQALVDMINGVKTETMSNVNVLRTDVTTLQTNWSVQNASITQLVTKTDVTNNNVASLRQDVNANTASISNQAVRINNVEQTATSVQNRLNAETGTYEEYVERINANTGNINSATTRLSAAEASIIQHAEHFNANDRKLNAAETNISALDSKITSEVSTINNLLSNNSEELTKVKTELDGVKGQYNVLSEKTDSNETNIGTLEVSFDKIKSQVLSGSGTNEDPYKIASQAINTDSITTTVISAVSDDINTAKTDASNALSQISSLQTTVNQTKDELEIISDSGTYDEEGNWHSNVNPAVIRAAITDDDGNLSSDITLNADTITLLGNTITENLKTIDLSVNGGASKFNSDGSGNIANGALAWNKNGDLSLNGVGSNIIITLENLISRLKSISEDNYSVKYENINFKGGRHDRLVTLFVTKNKALVNLRVVFEGISDDSSLNSWYNRNDCNNIFRGIFPKEEVSLTSGNFTILIAPEGSEFPGEVNIKTDGRHSAVIKTFYFDLQWCVDDEFEIRKPTEITETDTHNGHKYIDLGLPSNTMWSIVNYGSESITDAGSYLAAWGKISQMEDPIVYPENDTESITELNNIAFIEWGWDIPTHDQMKELIDNCSWDIKEDEGVKYVRGISKLNGNTILFPTSSTTYSEGWALPHVYWTKTKSSDIINGAGEEPIVLNTAKIGYIKYNKPFGEISVSDGIINRYARIRPVFIKQNV